MMTLHLSRFDSEINAFQHVGMFRLPVVVFFLVVVVVVVVEERQHKQRKRKYASRKGGRE